jgi:uncharacterized OsmC-like protein
MEKIMNARLADRPGLDVEPGWVRVVESGEGKFTQHLLDGRHRLVADEPVEAGGNDRGPDPYELLLMALGACTAMTVRLYVDRKKWPLTRIAVRLQHGRIYARDCADCETKEGRIDQIERVIELEGPLDAEHKQRILEIADKCPVHRTLTSEVKIRSRLAS